MPQTLVRSFSSQLPIDKVLDQLASEVTSFPQVILQAEPGAGKSTAVPLALLSLDALQGQKILMLEPRRLAAKRLAEFLAQQLDEKVGQSIGYRVRNESQVSAETRLEIITEGVLTRLIQNDPELTGVGLVIFDEFHERNLQADLGLALLLEIQQGLRNDLHCLIMSATLDEAEIKKFLPPARSVFCAGRSYPVQISYQPAPSQSRIGQLPQLAKVLAQALQDSDGDILLFLAGQAEIHKAIQECAAICQKADALALPLYGSLNPTQQNAVFKRTPQRKVIFSTNIAETSITLEGITAVIDSGLQKQMNYDPNVGMSRLSLQRISQASATQRMGRAGRVQAGHCYRLWNETQQQGLLAHDQPEICRVDLTNLRMEVAQWGVNCTTELEWLTEPPAAHIAAAETLLQQLDFLSEQGRLTMQGEQAIALHPEPRFAKLLQTAEEFKVLELACDLIALLQEGDVIAPSRQTETVDIALRLHWLWQALDDHTAASRLHRARWQNFKLSRQKLYQRFALDFKRTGERDIDKLGVLLALSYPDRIGKVRDQNGSYKLSNGRGVQLPENDAMQSDWIVAIDVNAQTHYQNQYGRIYLAATLDWSSVESLLPFESHQSVVFNKQKQRVEGLEQLWLGKLLVASTPTNNVPADLAQACLLGALQNDLSLLPWSKASSNFVERASWLSQFQGFESYQVLNEKALQQDVGWLQPYTLNMDSVADLQKLNLLQILQAMLEYSDLQVLDKEAPENYLAPSGREFPISYQDKQAKVSLQLQQLFGELASPKLAGGAVSLTFELLSPAQRPIQTTADLANFWQTSYFDVAKEMRGRYPKHRWPDEPLREKAGGSVKRRQ
ncbi:ATP-dependent helicase HrpB [Thiomicrorhabdus sp. 6S2-11]|uniref:ATP-dependent helicase HrpB n=1 Tax=Thiomicrorhabdus marina TaxID=2818442 RepID=A0ABS3Q1D0_9GAMM|nr:ATP-dependent helicase HrpB [Thiomicrorhabdus marina]MBO1926117.1 ATP-dependent helicase HrpB [Thiomicrorhabdus marina]